MSAHHRPSRHSCPSCGANEVRRSRRSGLIEQVVLRVVLMRPYRCLTCDKRFYNRLALPFRQYNTQRNEM